MSIFLSFSGRRHIGHYTGVSGCFVNIDAANGLYFDLGLDNVLQLTFQQFLNVFSVFYYLPHRR